MYCLFSGFNVTIKVTLNTLEKTMLIDVLIIGGSFAGLSAAMPLVRGRRQVLVLDTKAPRNRFARASHGVFCLDGKTPPEIQAEALAQLQRYPTFEFKVDEVIAIEKIDTGFVTRAGIAAHRALMFNC